MMSLDMAAMLSFTDGERTLWNCRSRLRVADGRHFGAMFMAKDGGALRALSYICWGPVI